MKIIIKKDFELIGSAGDIKEVKNGYARNYLIPRGIASAATPSNIKAFGEVTKQRKRKVDKETTDARKLATIIETNPLTITAKTAEEDKIYGSVTAQMIHDLLKEKGFEQIDRRKIHLHEPIRTLGEHIVDVKLYSNVIAKLKIIVEKEKAEEDKEQPAEENQQA